MTRRHIAGLAVGFCMAAASPSQGSSLSVSQPGAHCHPSNQLRADYYEYQRSSLVNTGAGKWDVFVGVCPISFFLPKTSVLEVRVLMEDPEKRDAWCNLYDGDTLDQETFVDWDRGYAYFSPPPWAGKGLLGATVHCLVLNGAAIKKIEIIWEVP